MGLMHGRQQEEHGEKMYPMDFVNIFVLTQPQYTIFVKILLLKFSLLHLDHNLFILIFILANSYSMQKCNFVFVYNLIEFVVKKINFKIHPNLFLCEILFVRFILCDFFVRYMIIYIKL